MGTIHACIKAPKNDFERLAAILDQLVENERNYFALCKRAAFVKGVSPDFYLGQSEYERVRHEHLGDLVHSIHDCMRHGYLLQEDEQDLAAALANVKAAATMIGGWSETSFHAPSVGFDDDGNWGIAFQTLNYSVQAVQKAIADPVLLRFSAKLRLNPEATPSPPADTALVVVTSAEFGPHETDSIDLPSDDATFDAIPKSERRDVDREKLFEILKLIRDKGPVKLAQLVESMRARGLEENTIKSNYIPVLKKFFGVERRQKGGGYFDPSVTALHERRDVAPPSAT